MSWYSLERTVGSLEQKVGSLEQKVGGLEQKVGGLEQKVEDRLYDTRPIWEKLTADIAQFQEGQEFLRREAREVHTLLRDIFRRLSIFNDTLVTMQADYATFTIALGKSNVNVDL